MAFRPMMMFPIYTALLLFFSTSVESKSVLDTVNFQRDNDSSDLYFNGEDQGTNQKLAISDDALPGNGEVFEGDMIMDNTLRRAVLGEESKKAATFSSEVGADRHWEGGRIPYVIDESLIKEIREKVKIAIQLFDHFTCVQFVPRDDVTDVDYVRIMDGDGCSSSVGRIGGEQTIKLGKGCKRLGTVMHEMMHVLGIIHEQSRPDRDEYLKIDFKNIKQDLLVNFQKYSFVQADTLEEPYNYYSVMHYSNHAFSKNQKDTLQAKFDSGLKFGQRVMISHLDAQQINRLYPCAKDLSKRSRCIAVQCGGKPQCCLYEDMTPKIILERKRKKRKDLLKSKWKNEWRNVLIEILRERE